MQVTKQPEPKAQWVPGMKTGTMATEDTNREVACQAAKKGVSDVNLGTQAVDRAPHVRAVLYC